MFGRWNGTQLWTWYFPSMPFQPFRIKTLKDKTSLILTMTHGLL
jgi:hypothetical protein